MSEEAMELNMVKLKDGECLIDFKNGKIPWNRKGTLEIENFERCKDEKQ